MCPGICLLHALFENIFHILITECLFKLRLSGRIDPLADDHGFLTKFYCHGIRGDNRFLLFCKWLWYNILTPFRQGFDVRRCRTTASPCHPCTHADNFFHIGGKFFRIDIIYRLTVFRPRKSGIRRNHQRQGRKLRHLFKNRLHLLWTESAVHAKRIYPEPL